MHRFSSRTREDKLLWVLMVCVASLIKGAVGSEDLQLHKPPNIVILLADDLGIGDVGCYGNDTIRTPHIDRLASEGVRLTHHLAAAAMCTPSRAALLTARYPARYGLVADPILPVPVLIQITSPGGIPGDEVTIATALAAANYTTAIVGKWHLGMNCSLWGRGCLGPLRHGFHSFFGLPMSLFQEYADPYPFWTLPADTAVIQVSPWIQNHANSVLMRDGEVVEAPIKLEGFSQRLVAESRRFITEHANSERPFFLFHSFGHVHTPMFTAPHMAGRSKHGRYGDNVEEMDEGVGSLLDTLTQLGLENNTVVYFASDHGGHLEVTDDDGQRIGGHNGRFKGGKRQGGSEGGIRVPGIFRWSGHLPCGVTQHSPTSMMDVLPTLLSLAGLPPLHTLVPRASHKELDGTDISEILQGGAAESQEGRVFLHHCDSAIHAVRLVTGDHVYKMHLARPKWFPGSTQCGWGRGVICSCSGYGLVTDLSSRPELYDLNKDPYEDKQPISPESEEYKVVVKQMREYLEQWKARVKYPPSQLSTLANIIWRPWYQPVCHNC
ncbi:arylsulfatase H-like isoform X2 [Scylla paramamosain]|uniref:arylsulfatase H-like isoform X2 n=1 Tax=Scylla paramamosain TaxID=85552 RepID=UPI0030835AE2